MSLAMRCVTPWTHGSGRSEAGMLRYLGPRSARWLWTATPDPYSGLFRLTRAITTTPSITRATMGTITRTFWEKRSLGDAAALPPCICGVFCPLLGIDEALPPELRGTVTPSWAGCWGLFRVVALSPWGVCWAERVSAERVGAGVGLAVGDSAPGACCWAGAGAGRRWVVP